MNKLTDYQLVQLAKQIDEASLELDILDPTNAIEVQRIEAIECWTNTVLKQVEVTKRPKLYLVESSALS